MHDAHDYPSPFPPHARGWTCDASPHGRAAHVSPARAGMDLSICQSSIPRASFPRTRGDGPVDATSICGGGGFPPHARGWTVRSVADAQIANVSPARAGMDPVAPFSFEFLPGFPRTRGDGPSALDARAFLRRFPPHARGWTPRARPRAPRAAVSPARAGMDPSAEGRKSAPHCFPRTRGDGARAAGSTTRYSSFPPHARGWTL